MFQPALSDQNEMLSSAVYSSRIRYSGGCLWKNKIVEYSCKPLPQLSEAELHRFSVYVQTRPRHRRVRVRFMPQPLKPIKAKSHFVSAYLSRSRTIPIRQ